MRRLLALVVLIAFGLPGLTPLFALGMDSDAGLAPCCRKGGVHACSRMAHDGAMQSEAEHSGETRVATLSPHCPYGGSGLVMSHPAPAAYGPVVRVMERVYVRAAGVAQTEARGRVSEGRSHQKRGPPVVG